MGMYTEVVSAAARPWMRRAITSIQNWGAIAASTLAAATPVMDKTNTQRRSARSAQRPAGIEIADIGSA